jgi:hypothetical protein
MGVPHVDDGQIDDTGQRVTAQGDGEETLTQTGRELPDQLVGRLNVADAGGRIAFEMGSEPPRAGRARDDEGPHEADAVSCRSKHGLPHLVLSDGVARQER